MSAVDAIQSAMLWGGLAATLLAAAFGTLIVRVILAQLGGEPRVAVDLVRRVGAGDLSSRIDLRPGDAGSLMAHLQAMQAGLRMVVATVREKAQSVETASAEIESGNDELSSRAASQASSLQETAASMEQLNATVKQNVDGARQARALGEQSAAAAVELRQQAQELAQAVAVFKLSPTAPVQSERPSLAAATRERLVLGHA